MFNWEVSVSRSRARTAKTSSGSPKGVWLPLSEARCLDLKCKCLFCDQIICEKSFNEEIKSVNWEVSVPCWRSSTTETELSESRSLDLKCKVLFCDQNLRQNLSMMTNKHIFIDFNHCLTELDAKAWTECEMSTLYRSKQIELSARCLASYEFASLNDCRML